MVVAPYLKKKFPDGWFEPWVCWWQLVQDRMKIRLLVLLIAFWS
jgi:hypothetical protein